MQPLFPETFFFFCKVIIGHYGRNFTTDCVITKFCFVSECNECEIQPVFSGPGYLSRHSDTLRAGISGDRILLRKFFPYSSRSVRNLPSSLYYGFRFLFPPPLGNNRTMLLSPFWALMTCFKVTFTFTCMQRECRESNGNEPLDRNNGTETDFFQNVIR
jgi:hypothetical protein